MASLVNKERAMKTITEKDVMHSGLDLFTAEASELGLKPGEWPQELPTTMGNKQPFVRGKAMTSGPDDDPDAELTGVNYHQRGGCISLKVWND
jgi:hypothetical protein